MPEYELTITIHETGVILVEAPTLKAAMQGVREGTIGWDQFDQSELPRIGICYGRLAATA